jgi:hypothetical protein
MKMAEFINIIDECCNDIYFSFHEKAAGITPEVTDSVKTFHVWHGEKDYSNADDVMNDNFFDGRSLQDIFNEISINIS